MRKHILFCMFVSVFSLLSSMEQNPFQEVHPDLVLENIQKLVIQEGFKSEKNTTETISAEEKARRCKLKLEEKKQEVLERVERRIAERREEIKNRQKKISNSSYQ